MLNKLWLAFFLVAAAASGNAASAAAATVLMELALQLVLGPALQLLPELQVRLLI